MSTATTMTKAALAAGGQRAARIDNHPRSRQFALAALPQVIARRFDAEAARGLHATLEVRIAASPGGEEVRYTARIDDGTLDFRRGAAPDARAWFGGSLADLILVVSGSEPWTALMAQGRLELGGDPFTALRVPGLFRL